MKFLAAAFLAACSLAALPALASQPAPAASPAAAAPAASASPAPTPSPTPTPTWQGAGYLASSYNSPSTGNVSGPHTAFDFANGGLSRVFDTNSDELMLNAVNYTVTRNGPIGGKLEVTAGSNANVIASYPTLPNSSFDVTQLYVDATSGLFTLQVGKFETLAGAEVIEDPSDVNVSRSILFGYAVPFTHTGVRLTFAPSSLFTFIAGANNGWDNLKGNGLGSPTAELSGAYNGAVISGSVNAYLGTERVSDTAWTTNPAEPTGSRTLIDVVATYHTTPKLTLQGNFDSGSQGNAPILNGAGATETTIGGVPLVGTATWTGVAGYAEYAFTSSFSAALRGETFNDADGYRTGYAQQWKETTLTLSYTPPGAQMLTFRVEGRADDSNEAVWVTPGGLLTNNLQSWAAQVLIKF
ncbi:MAG: outer membrane beta-barrel protein [Vulcanimicrobiaceae bacterium]